MDEVVSVIVPTRNSARTLDACLRSISNQTYALIELIVVDNNSIDTTQKIAQKYTRQVFTKGPERSAQRNFGASHSTGSFLLFIDSDMEVPSTIVADCVSAIQKDTGIGAVTIPEKSFGTSFWARCKQFEKTFYTGITWMESPRFFRRDVFTNIGGYNEALVSGEDWLLSQQVSQQFRIGHISEHILHNEGHLGLLETVSKKFYYATHLSHYTQKATKDKYRQFNPLTRVALFLHKPGTLIRHPILTSGLLVMKLTELLSGTVGYMYGRVCSYSPK